MQQLAEYHALPLLDWLSAAKDAARVRVDAGDLEIGRVVRLRGVREGCNCATLMHVHDDFEVWIAVVQQHSGAEGRARLRCRSP